MSRAAQVTKAFGRTMSVAPALMAGVYFANGIAGVATEGDLPRAAMTSAIAPLVLVGFDAANPNGMPWQTLLATWAALAAGTAASMAIAQNAIPMRQGGERKRDLEVAALAGGVSAPITGVLIMVGMYAYNKAM